MSATTLPPLSKTYPHVVIRWMACVYDVRRVVFRSDSPGGSEDPRDLVVDDRVSAMEADELVQSEPDLRRRLALLATVLALSVHSGRRMCVVFAADDAIYVEPDGTLYNRNDPPAGGVALQFSLQASPPDDLKS